MPHFICQYEIKIIWFCIKKNACRERQACVIIRICFPIFIAPYETPSLVLSAPCNSDFWGNLFLSWLQYSILLYICQVFFISRYRHSKYFKFLFVEAFFILLILTLSWNIFQRIYRAVLQIIIVYPKIFRHTLLQLNL